MTIDAIVHDKDPVSPQVMTMDAIVHATLFGTTVNGGPAVLQGLMRKHFVKAFDESLDSFPTLARVTGIDLATKLLGEDEVSEGSLEGCEGGRRGQ